MSGEEKRGEGRMSSRRTSKCSPADLLEERGWETQTTCGHTHKHGCNSFATATHFLLVFRGVGTRNRFKTFAFVRPPQALIEMLVREASRWPSSLRDAPCNHATLTSRVQIWPRTLTVPHPPISPSLCFLCCFPQS